MSEETDGFDAAIEQLPDHELIFKTKCFIRNDWYHSAIFLLAVILTPVFTWGMVDDQLTFAWLGSMLFIAALRWFSGFRFYQEESKLNSYDDERSNSAFWSGATILLSLLGGLGWGVASILFFPADSQLQMSLAALILLGLSGAGAISYSARPIVAITYVACVISPFATRLFFEGGQYEFTLASFLCVIGVLYCLAADRISQMLDMALEFSTNNDELIQRLEEQNYSLYSTVEKEIQRRRKLEKAQQEVTQKNDELDKLLTHLDEVLNEHTKELTEVSRELEGLDYSKPESKDGLQAVKERITRLSESFSEGVSHDQADHQLACLPNPDHDKPAVLLVNEDHNERKRIIGYLRDHDLVYQTAENVPEALSILCEWSARQHYFDLVIANRWLPDMNGLELAECLNEDTEFQNLPVALINSGNSLTDDEVKKAGLAMIIERPVKPEDISAAIHHLAHDTKNTDEVNATTETLPLDKLVNEAAQISLPHNNQARPETESVTYSTEPWLLDRPQKDQLIDQYVIDGLRASAPDRFPEIVNNFLEDIPQLINEAQTCLTARDSAGTLKSAREIGSRSLHMGAHRLVRLTKSVEQILDEQGMDKVYGQLQCIEDEFVQVESVLLSSITGDVFIPDQSH